MTTKEPGDRRQLAQPPSARYAERAPAGDASGAATSALPGPLVRAALGALLGAAALVLVGAVLASTFGLLFVGGAMGATIGLLLARAAVPGEAGSGRPVPRGIVIRLAIALAVGAVIAADIGTWLVALGEGGTLGLLDYLWTAFGPFVPGVALVAVVTAGWGASAGPVQR